MAIEHKGIYYNPFKLGLKHPKLTWMIKMLDLYGIAHRVERTVQGEMLYVQQGGIESASVILGQALAEVDARVKNDKIEGPVTKVRVIIDDLPNDHPFFELQLQDFPERLGPVEPTQSIEEYLLYDPEKAGTLTEDLVKDEPEEEADPWFDDDEEEVIEVESRDVTDEEFVEEEAVPVDKPKKVKPEPKEAVDPDFESAEDPAPAAPLVSSDDFLHADEELAFEDMIFPKVAEPLRMYDVDSSNVSQIGFKTLTDDPLTVTFYITYKGNETYRYNPVSKADANESLNLAVRKRRGVQEASVGSFLYHTVRDKADNGLIKCQHLVEEAGTGERKWVKVLPKKDRVAATKERAKNT
jgi:hypothetical protein